MQRNLNQPGRRSRYSLWSLLAIAAVLLSACGPLGDDDDPTATVETITQPTENPNPVSNSTPDVPAFLPDDNGATPEPSRSTPIATVVANNPPGMQATPDAPFLNDDATPVQTTPDETVIATPVTADENTSFAGSDGTSGATPASNVPPADDPAPTAAGSAGTPVSEPGATPEAVFRADLEPVTVSSCQPDSVPPLASAQVQYLTVTDVNFRAGPGSDCETIGDGPIGINIPVTVLSGPVVREGEEDLTWVQVQIVDDIGWIIIGVLEPVA